MGGETPSIEIQNKKNRDRFYIIILCTMEETATGTENKSRRRSRPSYAAAGSIGSLGLILFFLYLMSLQQGMFSVQKNLFPESEL